MEELLEMAVDQTPLLAPDMEIVPTLADVKKIAEKRKIYKDTGCRDKKQYHDSPWGYPLSIKDSHKLIRYWLVAHFLGFEEMEKNFLKRLLTTYSKARLTEFRDYAINWLDEKTLLEIDRLAESVENGGGEELQETVEKHDTLNPKLFDGDKLKPEVKEKLMEIVAKFEENLEENEVKFNRTDVIMIGSNASYNYNDKSDIDLHIIADVEGFNNPDELYQKVYSALKSLFNKKFDISFYGIPVEIYVETNDIPRVSNGAYSVMNDSWVKEPVAEDIPEVDQEALDKEVAKWTERYEELIKEPTPETIDKYIDDLYAVRLTGLPKTGEYGIENLTFKEVRNLGYIDELKKLKDELVSKELSLEEEMMLERMVSYKEQNDIRIALTRAARGNQPIIQQDGRFEIYNVKENEVDMIVNDIRRDGRFADVRKIAGKFDFSHVGFNSMPQRYWHISGIVKLDESLKFRDKLRLKDNYKKLLSLLQYKNIRPEVDENNGTFRIRDLDNDHFEASILYDKLKKEFKNIDAIPMFGKVDITGSLIEGLSEETDLFDSTLNEAITKLRVWHGEVDHAGTEHSMIWFSKDEEYCAQFGELKEYYITINNPLRIGEISEPFEDEDPEDFTLLYKGHIPSKHLIQIAKKVGVGWKSLIDIAHKRGTMYYLYDITQSPEFKDLVINAGYDGVIAKEEGITTYGCVSADQFTPVSEECLTENAHYCDSYKGYDIYREENGSHAGEYWCQKGYTDQCWDMYFNSKSELKDYIDKYSHDSYDVFDDEDENW